MPWFFILVSFLSFLPFVSDFAVLYYTVPFMHAGCVRALSAFFSSFFFGWMVVSMFVF